MKTNPDLKDTFYVSYGVFYLMGILTQVPFHFFINASDYWMYKFNGPVPGSGPPPSRPSHPPPPGSISCSPGSSQQSFSEVLELRGSSEIPLCQEINTPNDRTPLQINFSSSFAMVTQGSMLISFVVVTLFSNRFPAPQKRIVGAFIIICALFGISTVLAPVDTTGEIEIFFAASIITAILMNFCGAMALLSVFQLVTKFPVSYYPSLHSGQSLCGIIASLFQIMLLSTKMSPRSNGAYYFGFGTVIIFLATLFHITINKKSKYFIYRVNSTETRRDGTQSTNCILNVFRQKSTGGVKRIRWYFASLLFVQGSTAMIFPGFTALVVSENSEKEITTSWEEVYFSPVASYLIFHVCNFAGREAAKIVKTPKHEMIIMVLAVLRVAFVPMMIFCNAHPRNHLPVYFGDTWYMVLISVFAFTEGILLNLSILAIPSVAKEDEVEVAIILVPVISFFTITLCSGLSMLITNLI